MLIDTEAGTIVLSDVERADMRRASCELLQTLTSRVNASRGMTVVALGLSPRASRVFARLGIRRVADITKLHADDLLECKNFGEKCLREVEEKLAENGFALAAEQREGLSEWYIDWWDAHRGRR